MIKPTNLQKGDTVYLLSISRKGSIDMAFVEQQFKNWDLHTIIGTTITGEGFCQFAGTKEERLMEFQAALDNPTIKAIFFGRGGYGTVQIIDQIDFSAFVKHPKWLIGYSDITYLHSHIHQNFGIETIHSTMLSGFNSANQYDVESIKPILFAGEQNLYFKNTENHKIATITGEIVGGNLSILHTNIGTPSDLDTTGKILLLEDVFENLMSIERMLYALKRSGKLDNIKGLLLGDFSIPIKDNEKSNSMVAAYPNPTAENIDKAFRIMVLDLLREYHYPICFGLPIGHETGRNVAINLGAKATISLTSNEVQVLYS